MRKIADGCPHFQHHDPGLDGEALYGLYRQLRDHPVAWSDEAGGYWILSRFDDVRAALKDWETYSSADGCFLPDLGFRSLGLELDPPEHGPFRRLYLAVGGRPVVEQNEDKLARLAARIVDEFAATGGGDAVDRISEVLPVEAIALMAGLSAETASLVREMTVVAWKRMSTDPDALAPLTRLLLTEVERRRGEDSEDFMTTLANAEVFDRPITEEEVGNILVSTIVAGHETTMNASANLMLDLARDRGLQQRLRDEPDLIPHVVEESLRHRAPVHLFFRTLTRDVTLHGTEMQKGDKVAILYASANRDEERFGEDAEAFDPDREDVGHVSFGWGVHRCVGAPLAQAELRLLVQELLSRGDIQLDGEPGPAELEGGHHMGFKSLPLRIV
jgi:cytochrome P450